MMKHWLAGAAALSLMTGIALAQSAPEAAPDPSAGTASGAQPALLAAPSTKALQRSLNRNGAAIPVDGKMSPGTVAALNDYQYSHGLQVTGKPDQATYDALDYSAAERLRAQSDAGAADTPATAPTPRGAAGPGAAVPDRQAQPGGIAAPTPLLPARRAESARGQ